MDVRAKTRFARLTPSKARDLARRMSGQSVAKALDIAGFSDRKAGRLLCKTLKSAIANAEHNARLSVDDLKVKSAVVDEGPRIKRHWPRARGGVRPVRHKMAHLTIVLSDSAE
jgi:large subunit ribosomal protein L22